MNPILRAIGLQRLVSFIQFGRRTRQQEQERARVNRHLMEALEEEKRFGQRIAIWARTIALVVVAILLVFINPRLEVIYYEVLLLAFLLAGWAQLRLARVGQSRAELALIQFDLILLAVVLILPNPLRTEPWPTAIQYRFDGFIYYFLFLALGTLAYSWRTVAAIATWSAGIWLIGLVCVVYFGTRVPELSSGIAQALQGWDRVFEAIDPNDPGVTNRIQEVVVLIIVGAILSLKSWRANQLLMRQAEIAAERTNLSRYFPPSMVDELARRDNPLAEVRSQDAAVLFADIVGFTRIAEKLPPDRTIALLREFHALLADIVFKHGGTLDKFLGDGIMATFGTPRTAPDDADRALKAAREMVAATDRWNAERAKEGAPPFPISVGVHYGPVVLGDIGSLDRLEFATLGDTVNVASRLEGATRELGCRVVVSDSLVRHTARAQDGKPSEPDELARHAALRLRGRDTPID
ncbi:MAG: adenylate/guanylate cyclase domain-containing protein, partial [Pseudomonadota bacterium]|nr:adenylate/guanylate cyclase domain-containing protein [Pseudomonadota bacterium]